MKEYILWFIFLAFSVNDLTDTVELNPCSTVASALNISKCLFVVVQFCENNQAGNVILMMDGYLAETNPAVNSCSCIITTSHATKLYFIPPVFFPEEITDGCGSEISITNSRYKILMECKVSGSMEIGKDEYLTVVLRKKRSDANAKYCVYIHQEGGSERINATCSNSSDQFSLGNTLTSRMSDSHLSTSTSTFMTTDHTRNTYNRTNENVVTSSPDANMIMYYAIGGGGSGVVVVIMVVVAVVLCRRCSSKKSQKNPKADEDEADELQYNMLYVSSAKTDIDTYTVYQPGLSHHLDNEATYSTVDIEETEISNNKHSNQNYDLPNIKNTIFPAIPITPKSEDNATVQKSSVTHVTAPGGGSEYAVVNKQEKNNVTDSVGNSYAVVNKAWK